MGQEKNILIVDDEADARDLLTKVLEKEGFHTFTAESAEAGIALIRNNRFSAILLDYQLPGMTGLEAIQHFLEEDPEVKIIICTSHASIKLALEATKKGAYHFLEKPFDLDELRIQVMNAVKQYDIHRENARLREEIRDSAGHEYIRGKNAKINEIWTMVEKIAPSDATVLIEGESGTGKEVIARAIHDQSQRHKAPFIALNCAALSKELIESELFGHVKGAFTGAIATKKGRFESADGGTLFLDEIGEISPEMQAKLLRVLQEKTFERVGEHQTRKVDVRILAATNRQLDQEVKAGRFREDLYYRLNVVHIDLPPLRQRPEDILDLVSFFMSRFCARRGQNPVDFKPEALAFLQNYDYPGNIRELANILERAHLLCQAGVIELTDLVVHPALKKANPDADASSHVAKTQETNFAKARNDFELGHLTHLLTLSRGNVSQAARLAGMDRNNFKDKMRKFGIQWTDFKD